VLHKRGINATQWRGVWNQRLRQES